MPLNAIFFFLLAWSFHTTKSGMIKIKLSVTMLEIATVRKKAI